ncbi:MAG: LysR family transcriptional regulator [Pseudomonadota bacterium]
MDWDDFRLFSALAASGSVRGAAEQMGVNPSTVTRRLDQLEQHLGVRLFERSQRGLRLSPQGAAVEDQIADVGRQINGIERALLGLDQRLEGQIRFAVPDILAIEFLLDALGEFTARYPDIDLQIIPSYQELDLKLSEVDVAIRATDNPPQTMIGRPLTRVALAAYSTRDLASRWHAGEELDLLPWVDWVGSGEVMLLYKNLQERFFPQARVQLRCGQIQMHHTAVRGEIGAGILPCFLADDDPMLTRLTQMPLQLGPTLWLLSHPDLRGARRIQVFLEFVRNVFTDRTSWLLGESS